MTKYDIQMKKSLVKYNTHQDIADTVVWLIAVHKLSNPDCKDNCYSKVLEAITKKYR